MDPQGRNVKRENTAYPLLTGIIILILILLTVDFVVEYRQDRLLEERRAHKKKIERLAYYLERTNIGEISYNPKDRKYAMKLIYENVRPEEEMWIMLFAVKVFVQVGTLWREVPVIDTGEKRGEYPVERLDAPYTLAVKFTIPHKNYEELMSGYMHVKVKSISYVAAEAIVREDIIEKDEDMFIYVKADKKKGRVKTLLR